MQFIIFKYLQKYLINHKKRKYAINYECINNKDEMNIDHFVDPVCGKGSNCLVENITG